MPHSSSSMQQPAAASVMQPPPAAHAVLQHGMAQQQTDQALRQQLTHEIVQVFSRKK